MTIRVAVVGGGLGGLASAIALNQAGVDAVVFEQACELNELGAGIVVSPNMVKPLARLGLASRLPEFAVRLEAAWEFRRWQDGRVLFSQPMGDHCVNLYGAPCYVSHRADLIHLLASALVTGQLQLDRRFVDYVQTDSSVQLTMADTAGQRHRQTFDAVVGADGIHSRIRQQIAPQVEARFSGLSAFRCLVPADLAPDMAHRPVQTIWLGPGRHFVHYPISNGRLINIVAIAPAGDWRTESWTADASLVDLQKEFTGWDKRVDAMIASATETKRWALYDRLPLEQWTDRRVALLGDAAHAMLPFFAQGAAQAIEDALVLADCLRDKKAEQVAAALHHYEAIRRPRANQVQLMSRGREVRNHLPDGPEQQARDAGFEAGDPLRQSAWLYGHELDLAG